MLLSFLRLQLCSWSVMNISLFLTKSLHCLYTCTSSYSHIHQLRCIRPYLDLKTASTIATSRSCCCQSPPNSIISHMYSDLCIDSQLTNELITSYSLLHTKFLQPLNHPNCITWSLSNLLAVLALLCSSLLLALKPAPRWKSQTAHSDMHHLIFGTNFLFHYASVNLIHSHNKIKEGFGLSCVKTIVWLDKPVSFIRHFKICGLHKH